MSNCASNGVMFHHFHSASHPLGQGSMSADDFGSMIEYLKNRFRILNAEDYLNGVAHGSLSAREICLTFDDSLLCQVDIALPILQSFDIRAFFFVYSSAFTANPDLLEIYRYFRNTRYSDFDSFFDDFMSVSHALNSEGLESGLRGFDSDRYLCDFPFYSKTDRIFRYVRDNVLSNAEYGQVMASLMDEQDFSPADTNARLFMSATDLRMLHGEGHIVGLHSDTHPTSMDYLPVEEQAREYRANFEFIQSVTGSSPIAMSHPCGKYTDQTLELLQEMGIVVGFRSSMSIPIAPSSLEIPREDHANILAEMRT